MKNTDFYCALGTETCRTMAEWGVYWQSANILFTVIVGTVGLYKIYHELKLIFEQKETELESKETSAKLKRTEFFLSQHRRLFDNDDLFEILCLIDDDHKKLAEPNMADKKRKLLTFFEEIALLVKSNQIDANVAYYMFGYYANCILTGTNFATGIDTSRKYWGLLYEFTANSKRYLEKYPDGPPNNLSL